MTNHRRTFKGRKDVSLLNDDTPIHYKAKHNIKSLIDSCICSNDCLLYFDSNMYHGCVERPLSYSQYCARTSGFVRAFR